MIQVRLEDILQRHQRHPGFFSVQVLEDALKVWGLTLVYHSSSRPRNFLTFDRLLRWQSEEMRAFHANPLFVTWKTVILY